MIYVTVVLEKYENYLRPKRLADKLMKYQHNLGI